MSHAGITTRSAKKVSQAERAWHCQPRTKSSSPSLSAEGSGRRGASAPATAECQLGISSTPTCNRCCLASSASLAQAACGPSGRTRSFTIRAARFGNLDARTGKASTHDAQYAALEEREADCSPRPPLCAGRVATERARLSDLSSEAPRILQNVSQIAPSCPSAYVRDNVGGNILIV